MKRGPIIHGVLLLAALAFAYQTWTREEKVAPKVGDIKVWRLAEGSITSVVYDSKLKTVQLEKRAEGSDTYWWGTETKNITKKVESPDLPPGPDGKPQTVEEVESKVREFAVGKRGDELLEHLTELNALREITDLSDEKLHEYGLDESVNNLTVNYEGGSKNLIIGSKVFSGNDRFVRDTETGKAYAIAGIILSALMDGQGGMQLRDYHRFDDEAVGRVTIRSGDQTRELVRLTVESDEHKGVKGRKTWADARTPDKPDVTMANFLTRVKGLSAMNYEPESKPEDMTLLARLEYKSEKGEDLGWFEFYEKKVVVTPAPEIDPTRLPAPMPTDDKADGKPGDKTAGSAGEDGAKPAASEGAAKDGAPAKEGAKDEEGATEGDGAPAADKPAEPEETTAYYMRTELTRTLALLNKSSATRLAEDITQMLSAE